MLSPMAKVKINYILYFVSDSSRYFTSNWCQSSTVAFLLACFVEKQSIPFIDFNIPKPTDFTFDK